MNAAKHILISGDRGAGKSTLINRLLAHSSLPVYGFVTKRMEADEMGFRAVYINPAGISSPVYAPNHQIGSHKAGVHNVSAEVFNTLGVSYINQALPGGVIVMDELGFMEARAEAFVRAVFNALSGDIPVLASLKNRFDVPFLNEVRAHPDGHVYTLYKENRDTLFEKLLPVIHAWNKHAACLYD